MQGRALRFAINPLFWLAIAIAATVVVYFPGLSGDFVFDDTASLLLNKQLPTDSLDFAGLKRAALSGDAGPLGRPLSMLSFAINYYTAGGFDPQSFKLVNLGIHLLNGISIFVFLSLLLRALAGLQDSTRTDNRHQWLALAITAAWLLHPLTITSVLYVVQRMNSLATLFMLWGLILYLLGRQKLDQGQIRSGLFLMAGGIVGFGLLASLCKENGVLLPAYALAVEAAVFRFRTQSPSNKRILLGLFAATVLLPAVAIMLYLASHPAWVTDRYSIRGFSLAERLLTESRVLGLYLQWIVAPSYSQLGLFHDDISVSTGLLQPLTTILSIAGLALLLTVSFIVRGRAPLITLGILWFFVGHSLESSFLALELVHEHRNYLPMIGILMLLFYVLFTVTRNLSNNMGGFRIMSVVAFIALFGTVTSLRASQWSNNFSLFLTEAQNHPYSARATYEAGRQYTTLYEHNRNDKKLFDQAWYYLERSTKLDERSTLGFFGMIYLTSIDNQQIDPGLISELARRLSFTFIGGYENTTLEKLAAVNGERTPALSHDAVVTLYDAVLSNPTLEPVVRGMLYSSMSAYYANQQHRYADAAALAIKAIEAAPDQAAFNISFAKLLIVLRQFGAAREQLQIAKSKTLDPELLERIENAEMSFEGARQNKGM